MNIGALISDVLVVNIVGFSTAKGELVRSILFPKPIGFQFYQDAMKFILLLCGIATLGMIYSITTLLVHKVCLSYVFVQVLCCISTPGMTWSIIRVLVHKVFGA